MAAGKVSRLIPLLRAVDAFQRDHRPLAFAFAVNRKFGDDRAGQLAAVLTYYGFLSLFPLLLVLVTVLGLIAGGSSSINRRVEHSALSQFPIVGNQLGANIHELHNRSVVGLVVGIVGLVWGSQGAAQSGQFAMAEVWNLPDLERPGYLSRLGRTMATVAVVGSFLLLSTTLAGLLTQGSRSPFVTIGGVVVSLVLNIGLFIAAFRLLTPGPIRLPSLIPGAVAGGVGWTMLLYVGGALVNHALRNSSQVYGFFAYVLGLLAWIFLGSRLFLYSAEVNVVKERRLWPRSLVKPPLTEADRDVLTDITLQSKRVPEQQIDVNFEREGGVASATRRRAETG